MGIICGGIHYKISDFHNGNIELLKKNIKNFLFVIRLIKTDCLLWVMGCYGDMRVLNLKRLEIDILI